MDDRSAKREVIYWVDLVRVVAIILVVVVHVSGQLTNKWGEIPNSQWIIADISGGIARICVPLFFMVSGYLLLPRSESLRVFYTKRMPKILIPLIAWSLIYLGWFCGNHRGACNLNYVQYMLLEQGTYYHLWFLYSLTSIYLILPVLRLMITPETDKKILWYLILLWLIFQPAITLANRFWRFSINISAPLATGFVCYFVLGYLLGELMLSRARIVLATVIWIISTFITIIGTYLLTRNSGQFDGFFYDFVTFNVIFASGAAFFLLIQISETKFFAPPTIHALIRSLATGAFGVYLIHVVVIEVLSPLVHVNSFMGNAIWSIPLVSAIVFIISFVIVRILQKIPILHHIVP